MKTGPLVFLLVLLGLGIYGFFRSREIKKENPSEIEEMKKYEADLRKDLPFNTHITFKDSNYEEYRNNMSYIAWGIIAFVFLILAIFGVINIK